MSRRSWSTLLHKTKTKVLNISTAVVLTATSLGGALPALLLPGTAHADSYTVSDDPFSVTTSCDANRQVVWNLAFDGSQLPSWFLVGKIKYSTPLGGTTNDVNHNDPGENWTKPTGSYSEGSETVTARVYLGFVALGTPYKTYTVDTAARTCESAPVATDQMLSTEANTALDSNLDVTDAEGDALTYTTVTDPTHGDVTINADGSFTYTPDTDYVGSDSFEYKADDGTLNDTATVTINVVDTTDPSAGFTWPTPQNNAYVSNNFWVSFWAHDNVALKSIHVNLFNSNGDWVRNCYHKHNLSGHYLWKGCYITLGSLPDGAYTLKLRVKDQSGNSYVKTRTINIDRTNPIVTITNPANSDHIGGTVALEGTVVEANPGGYVWVVKDSSNNTVFHSYSSGSGNTSVNWDTTTATGDGVYTISLSAWDKAHNHASQSISVNVDNTAPSTPVASPAGSTYTSSKSVTLSSTDGSGNPVSIYYTTDGSDPSNTNGTLYAGAITISSDTTLKAIAYDDAGNASTIMTESYIINLPTNNNNNSSDSDDSDNSGSSAAEVLGISTTTPSNDESSDDTTGNVKGDNTNKDTSSDKTTKSSNFLGLGWWWILLLAIAALLWWLIAAARRRKDDEEN